LCKLAVPLQEADKLYKRKHISEAQLKALAIQCSGGNFFISPMCGSCTKRIDWLVHCCKASSEVVREALWCEPVDGYPRYVMFDVNQQAAQLELGQREPGNRNENLRVLRSINGGAFLFPIGDLERGEGFRSDWDSVRAFLTDPNYQMYRMALELDYRMEVNKGNFSDLVRWYGHFIRVNDVESFRRGAVEKLAGLIQAGHTEEI
jgi:hypothetical protein